MNSKTGDDYELPNSLAIESNFSQEKYLNSFLSLTPSSAFQLITDHLAINQSLLLQNDQPSNSTTTLHSLSYFETFTNYYSQVHGYLSLIVCVFGIIANLVNILVLTRKEMRTPTNSILTGLAIADLLVMADYVPFNIHNNIQNLPESERLTWAWAYITLLHMHVSIVFHTVSCWLTILLAIWRYLAVSFAVQTRSWLTLPKSIYCIVAVYIIVPIYCIPCYLSFTVFKETRKDNVTNRVITTHWVGWSNNSFLKHLNIWVFGVGSKLVPCILLTYLSFSLIHVLIETDKRKRRLREANKPKPMPKSNSKINQNSKSAAPMLSLSSPTNVPPLGVTHSTIDMTVLKRSLNEPLENDHTNKKCLSKSPDSQQPKTNSHLESGLLVASADSDQTTDQTTTNSTLNSMPNFDCNNNPNQCHLNNPPLSAHNSREKINQDQKRNSTSSISRQSELAAKLTGEESISDEKTKIDRLPSGTPTAVSCSIQTSNIQSSNVYLQSHQKDRTTKMLISVLLIFLLTEAPAGILTLLSSIIGESFFNEIYLPLGNIIDLLALVNSSINFILYCTMSKQFRQTFSQMILRRKRKTGYSSISKLKANRQHKKKSLPNKKKSDKKSQNQDNAKQHSPSDLNDKSSVFVTISGKLANSLNQINSVINSQSRNQ